MSYEKILNQIIEKYKINSEDLKGRAKNKRNSKIKKEFIKEVVEHKVISQTELADNQKVSE